MINQSGPSYRTPPIGSSTVSVIPRRAFIRGLALGIVVTPRAAGAQPTGKVYRIGVLSPANRPQGPPMDAFRQGLRERGYVDGRDFIIEYRAAGDTPERYPGLVAELVQLNVDVILALGTPPAIAAKQGTSTVPIVMVFVSDPIRTSEEAQPWAEASIRRAAPWKPRFVLELTGSW